MRLGFVLLTLLGMLLPCSPLFALATGDTTRLPALYLDRVDAKAQSLNATLSKKTTRYLQKLSSIEARILGKLNRSDSSGLPTSQYQQLEAAIQNPTARPASTYVPGLDTLSTTLKFLQVNNGNILGAAPGQLSQAGSDVQQLQGRLDESSLIQQYVNQRKAQLAQLISQYTHLPPGVTQAFANYKATIYYYRQQLEQYMAMLNDPGKIEREAVTILSKIPAYQDFLVRNSLLASLFQLPAGYGSGASLQGLQTQNQVQQLLQQQVGGAGASAVQGQLQAAQSQIASMQNAVGRFGAGGQDLDMPEFNPNSQKTKTFLKRLEYGANVQFARSAYDFPATGNLGLSLGYKINDKSTIGIGLAYSLGLGTGWNNVSFSSQGLGLRSFIDWKIKKTYYITGGYELNYMTEFSQIADLRNRSAWQPSALIGTEKKYKVSPKLTGNIQLLFDALYKKEIPTGQMFKFRVGYNF